MSLEDKFAPFEITTHTYKVVEGHPILADIFIPKKLVSAGPNSGLWKEKRPIVVRFHGGWLIGGQREFPDWTANWLVDLLLKYNAIYITADYRLLPETSGAEEILDDIDDLWKWVADSFPDIVKQAHPGLLVDLSRVLVQGESAGGYLALQSGLSLSRSSDPKLCAVIAAFPVLNLRSPHFSKDYDKIMFGISQQIPNAYVDEQIALYRAASARPIATNVVMDERTARAKFGLAVIQRGRLLELFGPDRYDAPGKRRVHPEDRVMDGQMLPPTFIYHGVEDSAVPVSVAEAFIELVKKKNAIVGLDEGMVLEDALRFAKIPGDHGAGSDQKLDSAEKWVQEMEAFVVKYWLGM